MYISKHHQFKEREAAFSLMASQPLGAWVCQTQEGLVANHLPIFLDRTRGPHGVLMGHVARANTVWRQLTLQSPSVVMFQGPQSYITPGWYPGKAEHGKVVPTWNYLVAHVHGTARVVEDSDWMLNMLNRLTDTQEAHQTQPWQVPARATSKNPFNKYLKATVITTTYPIQWNDDWINSIDSLEGVPASGSAVS